MKFSEEPPVHRFKALRVTIGALSFVGLVVVLIVLFSPSGTFPSADASKLVPQSIAASLRPRFSGITLHPYELLKNPYLSKGELVVLDVRSIPFMVNDSLMNYIPNRNLSPAITGFRLDKMIEEKVEIYNVTSFQGEQLGQIAAKLPDDVQQLSLAKQWIVEPLAPFEGTNGFGAAIQLPSVRFWNYAEESNQQEESSRPIISTAPLQPAESSAPQGAKGGLRVNKGMSLKKKFSQQQTPFLCDRLRRTHHSRPQQDI